MTKKAVARCNLITSHLQKPPENMKTLCFLDAFRAYKNDQISWDEYLRHLLVHLTGVRHKECDRDGMYPSLRYKDGLGYEIFCWSHPMEEDITDIGPLEAVFQAYRRGSLTETRDKLAAVDEKHVKTMRKCVAFLALQARQARMLEMCLNIEGGFPFENYMVDEADSVDPKQDPETDRVLEQSKLREYFPRLTGAPREDFPAIFDRGGKYPVDW